MPTVRMGRGDPAGRCPVPEARGEILQREAWEDAGWTAYPWRPPTERQRRVPRGAGIAAVARRLIALERTRMRRMTHGGYLDRPQSRSPKAV